MTILYMNENGDIGQTVRVFRDGKYVETITETFGTQNLNEEKVISILDEIERAAKVEGIKKFAVNTSCARWKAESMMEPYETRFEEKQKAYIAKAMELAKAKGYKFTGDITISSKPASGKNSWEVKAFKRFSFIEFEETVTGEQR